MLNFLIHMPTRLLFFHPFLEDRVLILSVTTFLEVSFLYIERQSRGFLAAERVEIHTNCLVGIYNI